jgi:hypothetical protein
MARAPSFSSHSRRKKKANSMSLDSIGDVHPNRNGMYDINNWPNSNRVRLFFVLFLLDHFHTISHGHIPSITNIYSIWPLSSSKRLCG